jgi:HEAT repeat protein
MRDLNAYETMAAALRYEDDSVRMAAAWGLRDCQDAAAVPVLAAVLLADDPDVRVKGLEALGANDTPDAIPVVRRSLTDPHPDVIYAGTLSLLELEGEESLQEIADVIRQTNGDARAQVLRGFFHASNYLKFDVAGNALADTLIDSLELALADDQAETRRAAIWPLAWIKHPRTPAILRQAYYHEPDREMKALFMRVAVSLMSEGSEELLQDALHNQDEVVRSAAERIMQERAQAPAALAVAST